MESYTTREVARLLGLSQAQVRSQARAGFLTPHRGPRNSYRFSFQDLLILRTARELAGARVPPRTIRCALTKLARHLPSGRALTELRIAADGDRVVVLEADTTWNAESEQLQIDFTTPSRLRRLRRVALPLIPPRSAERLTATQWFERGEELEEKAPAEAMEAYGRALALDHRLTDADVNLGRLLQLAGRTSEAIKHYRRAWRLAGEATAAFNLGTALEELGSWARAMAAYQQAIEVDPNFADAHFNLSRLYGLEGRLEAARRHLREYQRLST